MLTVYGEGRGFRVVWLLEEMGLPYKLRSVDLLKGVENDPEFLAINPGGFIPALVDGDTVMVVKDLKIKGSSSVVKVGTKVKNIRLVGGDHDIDCKIPGIGQVGLKSGFVKKVAD